MLNLSREEAGTFLYKNSKVCLYSVCNTFSNLYSYLPFYCFQDCHQLPERVNVYDNDEFDVMTHDTIDTSRIHKGKR